MEMYIDLVVWLMPDTGKGSTQVMLTEWSCRLSLRQVLPVARVRAI